MIEFALHEMLLQSEHLTRDPEEADFFFVPLYESCFMWPIFGHTVFPYFFEGGVSDGPGVLLEIPPVFHWPYTSHLCFDCKARRRHTQ